ncbi:hypothetical protein [Mesorhizobium sp. 128a]
MPLDHFVSQVHLKNFYSDGGCGPLVRIKKDDLQIVARAAAIGNVTDLSAPRHNPLHKSRRHHIALAGLGDNPVNAL